MGILKGKGSLIRKAVTLPLCISLLTAYSMVTLASPERVVGALTVSQVRFDGLEPRVSVNGESARSGRSVFSTSVISTSENATAILYFGKLGSLEISPNSEVTLSFDADGVYGRVANGRVFVLSAANPMRFESESNGARLLDSGDTLFVDSAAQDDDDADLKKKSTPSWIWAVLVAGVVAGVALGAGGGSGGNPRPVSPVQ